MSDGELFFDELFAEELEEICSQSESPEETVRISEVKKEEEEKKVEVEDEKEEYFLVEKVLDRKEDLEGITWYKIRWGSKEEGRQVWEESWTEESNLVTELKEEFEEEQKKRKMERGKGDGNEEVKSGCGRSKKRKLEKKSVTGGQDKQKEFTCTIEDCGISFQSQGWLTRHQSGCHSRTSLTGTNMRGGSGSCGTGGVTGGVDVTEDMEVCQVIVSQPPPPPTSSEMDDEDEGNGTMEIPLPPSVEEGNGGEISQAIPPPEEEGQNGSGGVPATLSSAPPAIPHVNDGQTPGTSASSILEMKAKVKIERHGGGARGGHDVKPKSSEGFDDLPLQVWVDNQRQRFNQLQKELQNEKECRETGQERISEQNVKIFDLEKELRVAKEKQKDAEDKLEEAEKKRKEAEERRENSEELRRESEEGRKIAEEKLLACQLKNEAMAEFAKQFISSQNAQRKMEEMATKFIEEVE